MIIPNKFAFSKSLYIAVLRWYWEIIIDNLEINSSQDVAYGKEEVNYN